MSEQPLFPIHRDHLDVLTGELGIWQHASAAAPNRDFGYCTDDVARALVVDLLHARELGWGAVESSAWRSLRFLVAALDIDHACFRNFRDRDGVWEHRAGSEDSQGRALLALGAALGQSDDAFAREAHAAFAGALPVARRLHALRAASSALIACDLALNTHSLHPALRADTLATFERLASVVGRAFATVDLQSEWPWPEPVLTYENGLLPQALLVAGRRLDDEALRRTGRLVLDWLIRVQSTPAGTFSPIGSDAWWPRGGTRSRFDQQPIEATAMMLAGEAAFRESGEIRDLDLIEAAYAWFLGENDLGIPVAVVETGGCHDGLTSRGVNLNEGAESTLMWLTALEHVRGIRRETAAKRERRSYATASTDVVGSRP